MSLQTTKIELAKAILDIESSDVIQKLIDFIKKEKFDFWNELSDLEQQEIKKGIEELDKGDRVSFESVLKKIS